MMTDAGDREWKQGGKKNAKHAKSNSEVAGLIRDDGCADKKMDTRWNRWARGDRRYKMTQTLKSMVRKTMRKTAREQTRKHQ